MEQTQAKLRVLSDIARLLNENKIVWALGASALLYFKGKAERFNDIDLMVAEQDAQRAREALLQIAEQAPPNPNAGYKTKSFFEFSIRGVDVDVMAGLVIVSGGKEYDCPFSEKQIAEYIQINGETIPLQALADWRRYYELMGRPERVEMIDR